MIKELFFALIISFFICIILGIIFLKICKKLKLGQPILKYVEEHSKKSGTPTMGGLFLVLSAILTFLIFGGFNSNLATLCAVICIAYMLVGFVDDFLKLRLSHNEGLKPYQKILFQVGISLIVGIYSYYNNLTYVFVPFSNKLINLGILTVPFLVVVFLATTNSVNLTDGLDGLAGSTSAVYLIFITILIFFEVEKNSYVYLPESQYYNLTLLSVCVIGSLIAYLIFNVNPAKVFMGDTGSLALGGVIASISIFSFNSFYILIIGVMFVFSSISVIVQVAYYKKTKKRIFLKAPFHHHLQLKGFSECRISMLYSAITGIMGVISIIFYL